MSIALGFRFALFVIVFSFGYAAASNGVFFSEVEQRTNIIARLIFLFVAQSLTTDFFSVSMLQVGRRLIGDDSSALGGEPTKEELALHNPNIVWPRAELLAPDLVQFVSPKGQPFFLNHVTARHRCKDACMRIGMNVGSFVTVWCLCVWMDRRSLASIGLTLDVPFFIDLGLGLCVGFSLVFFMFAVELGQGWVRFLEFFEVFDQSERFVSCIFWDVVFHLNVTLNEELPLRGWMLHNLGDAFGVHFGFSPVTSFMLAAIAESALFVFMHIGSPGGNDIKSMANIALGGMAGGLNVLVTGGRLGFSLGWHFGWNISMGNIFGLSTSGIPISGTFVAVAPHPEKERFHGGVFGPEGGLLAPFGYGLGILLLLMLYGVPDGNLTPAAASR
jgi:hypothetical protein